METEYLEIEYVESMEVDRKRSLKTAKQQYLILVKYMEENKDFSCGNFNSSDGKALTEKHWQILGQQLNSNGLDGIRFLHILH